MSGKNRVSEGNGQKSMENPPVLEPPKPGAEVGDTMAGGHQDPTHFAVPIPIFQVVRKLIGKMPHDKVAIVCRSLDDCMPLSLMPKEQ